MAKKIITLPIVKFELTDTESGISYDVTDNIENSKEVEIKLSRNGLSGVISEVTFPIIFVEDAREIVRDMFDRKGMYAEAAFSIYRRGDAIPSEYRLIKSMQLDFREYKDYNHRIEIQARKSELVEIINSSGKTKFDIKVSDIAEPKKWRYDRINVLNGGSYVIAEDVKIASTQIWRYSVFPIHLSSPFQSPGSPEHDMKSQQSSSAESVPADRYFFKAAESVPVNLKIKGNFRSGSSSSLERADMRIRLLKNESVVLYEVPVDSYVSPQLGEAEVDIDMNIQLSANDRLSFVIVYLTNGLVVMESYCHRFDHFELEYITKSTITHEIDVIKPDVLLQKFLDLTSNRPGYFTSEINWGEQRDDAYMLCAGESIRNLTDAYLHGSLKDLIEWLRIIGFEYELVDNRMIWQRRGYFYNPNITALELESHEIADLVIQADPEYAYTRVVVGYEREEYDNNNGRLSYNNGVFEYTTDFVNIEENELSLISPYKADIIGIELLTWTRNQNTRDTKSDNDIYCIVVDNLSAGSNYKLYTGVMINTPIPEIRLPNATLNPYFLVRASGNRIGIGSEFLRFAGTDIDKAQNAVFSNGLNPYVDMEFPERLFNPVTYNFAAGSHQNLPDASVRNGLIKFTYEGKKYAGYIKEYRKNEGFDTETTWELWALLPRKQKEPGGSF